MATIAVGDIHGNLAALTDILGQIRAETGQRDTVVFLGDYIDRGPDAKGCVDAILEFQRQVAAQVVCLVGNHEEWLLRTLHDSGRHSWLLGMEAFSTIRSYSPSAERILREATKQAGAKLYLDHCVLPYETFFDCVPREHISFFEGLRLYHRSADCVCTHGGLDPGIAEIETQSSEALIWGAGDFPNGYEGSEVVVYGHRNNSTVGENGWPEPTVIGRTIGIDTIAHGVLTAVQLPAHRIFQSARYEMPDVK
jgi:serine/threonine protein phosphatase 1